MFQSNSSGEVESLPLTLLAIESSTDERIGHELSVQSECSISVRGVLGYVRMGDLGRECLLKYLVIYVFTHIWNSLYAISRH
jgi:hypothetical protein